MTYPKMAICLAAVMTAGTAQADVTAQQVWDDWKSLLFADGDDRVTIGAEETSSGTVTVRDLAISIADEDITLETGVSEITFNELSDGTVRVTMDDSYPMTITGDDGVVVTLLFSQQNVEMIVSGAADAMDYDITADSYSIALQDVVDGDVTYTGDAAVTANDVRMTYQTTTGDLRDLVYDAEIATLDIVADLQIPETGGDYITGSGQIRDMQLQGAVTMPIDADITDPDMMSNEDFAMAAGYVVESAAYVFDIISEGEQATGSVTTGTTTLNVDTNSSSIGYDASTTDIAVNVETAQVPLPINVSLAEYGFRVLMPTGATQEPADFALRFDIVDLVLSDMLWNMFDGQAVLPRDPITMQLAVSGQARVLFNMFDPDQQSALMNAQIPYEPETLALDTLNITGAGASVTGEGDFVFDNSDMQSFAPFPRPEGTASIQINGLNMLLDNLVAMGLVAQEDVMGPRMMMGMFARSTGDDQMETTLEVTPEGQVNVNGNRIR